jgi:hypothetical protein
MKIKTIGDWTCSGCGALITLELDDDLCCGACGKKAKLKDLLEQDDENVYFNEVQ